MLGPVRRNLKRHGAYLLQLPSAAIRPGALLLDGKQLFQDLLEVDALWSRIPVIESSPARFLIDKTRFEVTGGGQLGLGLPQLGSIQAVANGSRTVSVEVRGVSLRRALDTQIEHAADWLNRMNQHLVEPELAAAIDLMKRRRAWAPSPRALDLAEATVHVEKLLFRADSAGQVDLDAEIQSAIPADVKAGFEVTWTRSGELSWRAGDVPIGFIPLRYAWSPRKGRFVAARV